MLRFILVLMTFTCVATVIFACSSSATIDSDLFDKRCSVDSDCVLVDIPQDCCFGCGNLGINKKDLAKYQAEAARVRDECGSDNHCPGLDCFSGGSRCDKGTCAVCTGMIGPDGGCN